MRYVLDLNVDLLDVHADKSTFHHFDKFNLKYNPCGQSRFLAEVTSQVFVDLEASEYQGIRARLVSKDFAPKWDIPNLDIPTSEPELNMPITLREPFHSIHDNGGGKFWVPKTDWFLVVLKS
uniref:Uncharacterized protein n=1 Tax=Lactuca sativa TaxID=4236 RepID=A0A9R1UU99_LACSA|nr:hypothetical protein LSAT_V11C800441490 [Lactuca sativa]